MSDQPIPAETLDVPAESVKAAAEVMLRQYDSQYNADHLTWLSFTDDAREIAAAAARAIRAAERERIARLVHAKALLYEGITRDRIVSIAEAIREAPDGD